MTGRRRVDLAARLAALPPPNTVPRTALRGCLIDDVREGLVLADVVDVDQREAVAEQLGAWFDLTAEALAFAQYVVQGLDDAGVQQVIEYAELLKRKAG